MKKEKKTQAPEISEFTDEEGKKWIPTSPDDLFSIKELNDILATIEKDRETDKVILARIDFQKVNREYYDAARALQTRLARTTDLLREVIEDSKQKMERKNRKLKELIAYIKKLHAFIAGLQQQGAGGTVPPEILAQALAAKPESTAYVPEYEDVEETVLTINALDSFDHPKDGPGHPKKDHDVFSDS